MKQSYILLLAATLLAGQLCAFRVADALTISPVKVEVVGEPGQVLHGEIELFNEQEQPKQLYTSFENFEPSDDSGSPRFIGGGSGLASWMSAQPQVTVGSSQTVTVPYEIAIPADTEPGGYFAAIFWGEQDPAGLESGQVAIGGKLGTLILLRVAGDIEEAAGISDFGTVDHKRLHTTLPISFFYRFRNEGGDRVVPLGEVTITNMFGGVSTALKANQTEGSVLPNSTRKFTPVWEAASPTSASSTFFSTVAAQASDFHFGFYKASLALTYGTENQTATSSFWFFIIPWQLLLVVFVVLCIGLILLRRYNAWIVNRAHTRTSS